MQNDQFIFVHVIHHTYIGENNTIVYHCSFIPVLIGIIGISLNFMGIAYMEKSIIQSRLLIGVFVIIFNRIVIGCFCEGGIRHGILGECCLAQCCQAEEE